MSKAAKVKGGMFEDPITLDLKRPDVQNDIVAVCLSIFVLCSGSVYSFTYFLFQFELFIGSLKCYTERVE